MLERFSDRARSAVDFAELETRRLGHHHIGTEHLLLGVLSEGDSNEAQTMRASGVTLDAAREKVIEAVGTKVDSHDGEPEFTARARRALERASRFSLQRLDDRVELEHLLLGVLDVEGTACQVLRRLGADVGALRRSVDQAPAATAAPEAEAPSGPTGRSPVCPNCREILATVLAHRVLTATDEAGTTRDFVIAFCSACGTAVSANLV